MRLAPATATLAALVAVVAAGCASTGTAPTVPATVRAPPQSVELSWREPYPPAQPALVFGVSSFKVTRAGWTAEISVQNRSKVGWEVGDPRYAANLAFGVLLFPDDDLDELERRNRAGDLPAIRSATRYEPALPLVLKPGTTWKGTISAPGALAGGLWVRISFGPFVSVGTPPEGAEPQVVWFTDHAYRLETIAGEPA